MVRITSPSGMPIHASSSVSTLTAEVDARGAGGPVPRGQEEQPQPVPHVQTATMKPARPSTGSRSISHSMSFQVAESPIAVWIHPSIPRRCGCR